MVLRTEYGAADIAAPTSALATATTQKLLLLSLRLLPVLFLARAFYFFTKLIPSLALYVVCLIKLQFFRFVIMTFKELISDHKKIYSLGKYKNL